MNVQESIGFISLITDWLNASKSMFDSVGSALVALSTMFFTFSGICSAMAARMPKPNDTAPISYMMLYRFVNRVAFNYGHAENKS